MNIYEYKYKEATKNPNTFSNSIIPKDREVSFKIVI